MATSDLFAELSRDVSPAAIAALGGRLGGFGPHPSLDKCVAAYVYEQIRERELPDAPSRLNCLFAARDAYAAVEFASMYMPLVIGPTGDANIGAPAVSTADGAWVELDMNSSPGSPVQARDESEIAESLAALTERASHYWHGESSATMRAVAIFFHVTPAANRDSIRRHGLDWRLGGGGIAGSREPEKPGVFLARSEHEADFFIRMGERRFPALDLWEVTLDHDASGDVVGSEVLSREFDGFLCWMQPIPPSHLRLRERDVTRPRSESATDGPPINITMTFTPTMPQPK